LDADYPYWAWHGDKTIRLLQGQIGSEQASSQRS
jgi:hypothetical protein